MAAAKKYSWKDLVRALGRRKTGAMFVLGFAAGLPYVLITGTLNAVAIRLKDANGNNVTSLFGRTSPSLSFAPILIIRSRRLVVTVRRILNEFENFVITVVLAQPSRERLR